VLGTDRGIELRSIGSRRRIAWTWAHVRDIEVGRVEMTSGAAGWGLILTVAGPDGDDRVPLAVRPGVYRPFVTRSGLVVLRAQLLALRDSVSGR
jgi:hypothetical protein